MRLFDEVYAVASFILHKNYLSKFDSTFTEQYYGIRRSNLTRWNRILCLLTEVFLPYISDKLKRLENKSNSIWNIYQPLRITFNLGSFIMHIGYLFKVSRYFTLEQMLLDYTYVRVDPSKLVK
jgi:hypothetical protein